ncbi:hypothetical protein FKM82_013128 [Ascaphus truei]
MTDVLQRGLSLVLPEPTEAGSAEHQTERTIDDIQKPFLVSIPRQISSALLTLTGGWRDPSRLGSPSCCTGPPVLRGALLLGPAGAPTRDKDTDCCELDTAFSPEPVFLFATVAATQIRLYYHTYWLSFV